jgi:RNA polymerase sigma-70 factor (ECF subfamily)
LSLKTSDDRSLASAAASGDERAFEELLRRYERRIFALGLRMCGQRQDAEEMVQDTFLAALQALPRFRFDAPFLNWLFRIAARRCGRMRRPRSGQPLRIESLEARREAFLPDPADQGPGALERLLRKEGKELMARSIRRLPKGLRLTLVLRDLEGLDTEETAAVLGVSPGLVKTRLHRARLGLRKILLEGGAHAR